MDEKELALYKTAIETQNFEIQLFWKRSLFFAAFVPDHRALFDA